MKATAIKKVMAELPIFNAVFQVTKRIVFPYGRALEAGTFVIGVPGSYGTYLAANGQGYVAIPASKLKFVKYHRIN